jgi:hypothetical protein
MRNNVLYFPFINVPNSLWFTQILLYWDKVSTIIPFDFIQAPERLDPFTRDLIRAQLLKKIIPRRHIYNIPMFVDSFMNYIESLGDELELRRSSFQLGVIRYRNVFQIHMEKGDEIFNCLKNVGLSTKPDAHGWVLVEATTGSEFMAYLAASLGQLDDVDSIPVTDSHRYLLDFVLSGSADIRTERKLNALRYSVLKRVFPAPIKRLSVADISRFKSRHGNKLIRFRNLVEQNIVRIADMNDLDLRQRSLDLFMQEIETEIEDVKESMKSFGWRHFIFGKLFSVMAPIPAIGNIFGLANALYNCFRDSTSDLSRSPLLYAAEAQMLTEG